MQLGLSMFFILFGGVGVVLGYFMWVKKNERLIKQYVSKKYLGDKNYLKFFSASYAVAGLFYLLAGTVSFIYGEELIMTGFAHEKTLVTLVVSNFGIFLMIIIQLYAALRFRWEAKN